MESKYILKTVLSVIIVCFFCCSCTVPHQESASDPWSKVEFNPDNLDQQGLRGPADGKVAVSYEFAIPNTETCKRQVRAIDPTVEFLCGSRGRIGAGKNECLCIGSTHQPNYRDVLVNLAKLPYVKRIIECYFE